MRLLIIGNLGGQIGAASQIAIKRGGKVAHADSVSPFQGEFGGNWCGSSGLGLRTGRLVAK